jgi:hypothetical protein
MQFDHITIDTNQGAWREPAVEPWFVVRCGIRRSNSLSNSMIKATRVCERRVDSGRRSAIPLVLPYSWNAG